MAGKISKLISSNSSIEALFGPQIDEVIEVIQNTHITFSGVEKVIRPMIQLLKNGEHSKIRAKSQLGLKIEQQLYCEQLCKIQEETAIQTQESSKTKTASSRSFGSQNQEAECQKGKSKRKRIASKKKRKFTAKPRKQKSKDVIFYSDEEIGKK